QQDRHRPAKLRKHEVADNSPQIIFDSGQFVQCKWFWGGKYHHSEQNNGRRPNAQCNDFHRCEPICIQVLYIPADGSPKCCTSDDIKKRLIQMNLTLLIVIIRVLADRMDVKRYKKMKIRK